MDLSPKAPRRFSRWQTTKRPFNIVGASSKPPSTIPELHDDNECKVSKETSMKVDDGKKDKIQKNPLNHPSTDSVPKQPPQISSSVKRSAVVRRLCLNTSKRTESKNEATISAEVKQPELSYGGPKISAFDEKRLLQNAVSVSADKQDIFLAANELFPHNLPKHARQDDGDISSETAHHNSKCALSSISQNASANKPTKSHSSQGKVDISLNCAAQNEAGALTGETNKRNRPAIEDEELSSTSGTDKENKDSDPAVPPVIKKLKLDGTLHNLSTSKPSGLLIKNVTDSQDDTTVSKQNIEGEGLSARMSSLRNRSLLTSPRTLMKNRQYPIFPSSKKKSEPRKDSSSGKDNSCTSTESSFTKKVANRRVSPVSEIKSKQHIKKTSAYKTQSKNKGNSSNSSRLELKNQSITLHTNKTQNSSETAATKHVAIPEEKQVNYAESNQSGSSSVRGRLRDRRSLPTPEEVQQKRQYPISFYLSSKKSSENIANSSTSREVTAKRKRSIESTSSLDKSEFTVGKSVASSKHEALESSKNKIGNRNNSRSEVSTIDNQVSSKKHSQLIKKSRKMLNSTHLSETATVDVGNTSRRLLAGNNVKHTDKKDKQSSIKHNNKANYSQELDDVSLSRGHSKKSSSSKHSFSSTAEKCPEFFATTDVSVQRTQSPETAAETSHKPKQHVTHKGPLPQPNDKRSEVRAKGPQPNDKRSEVRAKGPQPNDKRSEVQAKAPLTQPNNKRSEVRAKGPQPNDKRSEVRAKGPQPNNKRSEVRAKGPQPNDKRSEVQAKAPLTQPNDKRSEVRAKGPQPNNKRSEVRAKGPLPQPNNKRSEVRAKGPQPNDKRSEVRAKGPLPQPNNKRSEVRAKGPQPNDKRSEVRAKGPLPQPNDKRSEVRAKGPLPQPNDKRSEVRAKGPQPNDKRSKVRAVGPKLAMGTSVGEQINETVVAATKHPRKRKLVEEMARAEEAAEQSTDNEVVLWCDDGPSGRTSRVTAYDVILQAMIDMEDKMLDEAEEGSIEHRAVKKVMSRFRNKIKQMASKVKEVNNLKSDIRQRKSRIKKLMAAVKEKKKMERLSRENHSEQDNDQDVLTARYEDLMKSYNRLMDRLDKRS